MAWRKCNETRGLGPRGGSRAANAGTLAPTAESSSRSGDRVRSVGVTGGFEKEAAVAEDRASQKKRFGSPPLQLLTALAREHCYVDAPLQLLTALAKAGAPGGAAGRHATAQPQVGALPVPPAAPRRAGRLAKAVKSWSGTGTRGAFPGGGPAASGRLRQRPRVRIGGGARWPLPQGSRRGIGRAGPCGACWPLPRGPGLKPSSSAAFATAWSRRAS